MVSIIKNVRTESISLSLTSHLTEVETGLERKRSLPRSLDGFRIPYNSATVSATGGHCCSPDFTKDILIQFQWRHLH